MKEKYIYTFLNDTIRQMEKCSEVEDIHYMTNEMRAYLSGDEKESHQLIIKNGIKYLKVCIDALKRKNVDKLDLLHAIGLLKLCALERESLLKINIVSRSQFTMHLVLKQVLVLADAINVLTAKFNRMI